MKKILFCVYCAAFLKINFLNGPPYCIIQRTSFFYSNIKWFDKKTFCKVLPSPLSIFASTYFTFKYYIYTLCTVFASLVVIQSSYTYIYLNSSNTLIFLTIHQAHGKQHLNTNNFFRMFLCVQGKHWIAKRYGIWYDVCMQPSSFTTTSISRLTFFI